MDTIKNYAYVVIGLIFIALLGYLLLVKNQRDNARNSLDLANKRIELLQNQIEQTNKQLKIIRQLDSDYQERLANAQAENDKLRDDLINNVKRVYIKANCSELPKATTASKPNATTAQLTGNARQDYLRLRLEIKQVPNQVEGLQSYINNVCLRN